MLQTEKPLQVLLLFVQEQKEEEQEYNFFPQTD